MEGKPPVDADWLAEIEDVDPLKKEETPDLGKHNPVNVNLMPKGDEEQHPEFMTTPQWDETESEGIVPLPTSTEPFTRKEFSEGLFCAARAGIDERTFNKLKKGAIAFEDVLDLHGYVEEDAWSVLMDYLNQAYLQGLRCVIIVHGKGKGYGPNGKMGVIKVQTPNWLESHAGVLAYHTTQPKHGGSGAVYVLIRRQRKS